MDLTGHVHLLLGAPGQPAPVLPASPWRLWTLSDQGLTDPAALAATVRPSPMTARAEKALLAAVAADDVDALGRLAGQPGGSQDAAQVLYAGRLVGIDTVLAAEMLIAVLSAPADPAASKVLRRHWGGLHVAVTLAPGVPALVPVSQVGMGLLLAEVCAAEDRPADAVAVLRQLPPQPVVALALAATLLAMGEHDQVIEVTTRVESGDDISTLALVARSVAARTKGDLTTALDAVCGALAHPERSRSVIASALEERARVHVQAGNDAAARDDLEVLTALAGGAHEFEIPSAAPLAPGDAGSAPEDDELHRARDRMRRRIMGVGAPGTFGGRHHSTYRDDVADMFALGQTDAAEELLLGLLDAVEDEVAETGVDLDPTFFLTLADLYEDSGRTEDIVALQERFAAAQDRANHPGGEDRASETAGEHPTTPAPFDARPPDDVDPVSIDGEPVDVGAAVEHLLVSVGVAPARRVGEQETSSSEPSGGSDPISSLATVAADDEAPAPDEPAADPEIASSLDDGPSGEPAEAVGTAMAPEPAPAAPEAAAAVAADDHGVEAAPAVDPEGEAPDEAASSPPGPASPPDGAVRPARGPRIRSL